MDPNSPKKSEHPVEPEVKQTDGEKRKSYLNREYNRDVKYKPTWESLDSRPLPGWYDEAKIGIFIHWGVFSVPSYYSEWFWWYFSAKPTPDVLKLYPNKTKLLERQKKVKAFMKKTYPDDFQYTDFAPQFKAEFFDPEEWADIFAQSGAKYVVLTSKHHEGFTMWGSKRSWNWNAVDNGPHRDLVGDLGAAVRARNIRYGLYHSLFEWFNPLYLQDRLNNYTTQNFVREKMLPEIVDLVTKYRPDILWSDGDWETDHTYFNSTHLLAWLFNHSPVKDEVVVNDRWGSDIRCKHGSFLNCDDRYLPDELNPRKWENCFTLEKKSWGYRRDANINDYYSMDQITDAIVKTISLGGNILMNIGPTADGRIIPIYQERLLQIGSWLKVNGEAIYGTRPWKYQSDPLQTTPNRTSLWYTSKTEGSKKHVYAIALDLPKKPTLDLQKPVTSDDTKVTWMGYNGKIEWKKLSGGSGISITIPRLYTYELPCEWAWVFKLENLKNAS